MTLCGDPAHATWPSAELAGKLPADYLGLDRTPEEVIEGRVCACGGMVWANPLNPRPGVAAHNATECHQAWSELEGEREAWGEE